jgi:hypothetical protein
MSIPRRRLVRSSEPLANSPARTDRQIQKLRSRLNAERNALARWRSRLKRAFNAVEKAQRRITRLERQLARLEE